MKRIAPPCAICDRKLKSVPISDNKGNEGRGWGYNGKGYFCSMRCAAEYGNAKVDTSYDESDDSDHSHWWTRRVDQPVSTESDSGR